MASRLQDVIQRDTRALQPLATAVAPGTLYYVTDEAVTERSNGTAWEDFTDTGGGGGTGDVVGPAGATADDVVTFDGVTGKLIKDSGFSVAGIIAAAGDVDGPAVAVNNQIAVYDGITGKLIKDGGKTIATVLSDAAAAAAAAGYVVGPALAVADQIAIYNGITGKIIKDGGKTIATVLADALAAALAAIIPVDLTSEVTGLLPAANIETNMRIRSVGVTIDGGGVAITTGVKADIRVPYACTIQSVTLLADQSGSIVIDIWKDTYANYPPVVGDSITAAAKPTIAAALKSEDVTLTGWTTSIAAGDTLRFNVDSITTLTRVALILKVQL